jgi:hypothetical protein
MKRHLIYLSSLSAVLMAGFLFFNPSRADALVLAPAKVEIEAAPGNVVRDRIILLNDSEETVTYYSSVERFEAQGETGTPNFVASDTGLASWVTVTESVTLAPNESEEIPYTINVPVGAEPGGHFAAIFWSTFSPDESGAGQVLIGTKTGVLFLVGVEGDFEEKGGVTEFDSLGGSYFTKGLPLRFFYRFQNDGGDRLKPEGVITIKSVFGTKASVLNANLTEGNILPMSVRKFEVLWSEKSNEPNLIHTDLASPEGFFAIAGAQWKNFLLGPYTAELQLAYGADRQQELRKLHFFVFPWQLLLILFSVLSVFIFGGKRLLLRYNRWIIAQAGASKKEVKKNSIRKGKKQ